MTTVEILQELGVDYHLVGQHQNVRNNFIGVDCPWCEHRGEFLFGIPPFGWIGSCWACGRRPLVHTLAELSGQSYHVVTKLFEARDLDFAPDITQVAADKKLNIPHGVIPMAMAHRDYLAGRGIDPEHADKVWGVRGIGIAPRYQWSLFLPIHHQDVCVSWTTRTIGNKGKRYDSAPAGEEAMRAKSLLYGEDFVRNTILVVEGPLDAVKVGPGTVATFGLNYSTDQLARISRYPVRGICFDAEPVAQTVARRLCGDLAVFPGKTVNFVLETGKDPGEAREKEVKKLREFVRQ